IAPSDECSLNWEKHSRHVPFPLTSPLPCRLFLAGFSFMLILERMRIVFEMMETVTRRPKETMRWHGNSDVAGHLLLLLLILLLLLLLCCCCCCCYYYYYY